MKNLEAEIQKLKKQKVTANETQTEKGKGGMKNRNGVGPCSLCKSGGHDLAHCYKNPKASDEVKAAAEAWRARNPGASVHMVNTAEEPFDSTLDAMNTSFSSSGNARNKQILLDGGSDCFLFNRFYKHLLFRLEPHASSLSGIGGDTGKKLTHKGNIIFMGHVLTNVLYSPYVDKSVLSEGLLCAHFGYKIVKEGPSCTLTNLANNTLHKLQLDVASMNYILPPELFDINYEEHYASLASVRPSNMKTLWHGRFGRAYMGLIIKMARLNLYSDRGLKLPEALLKADPDEDLCDACALGKPTFSFSYVDQFRSTVKGKLWYFDVSRGGRDSSVARI